MLYTGFDCCHFARLEIFYLSRNLKVCDYVCKNQHPGPVLSKIKQMVTCWKHIKERSNQYSCDQWKCMYEAIGFKIIKSIGHIILSSSDWKRLHEIWLGYSFQNQFRWFKVNSSRVTECCASVTRKMVTTTTTATVTITKTRHHHHNHTPLLPPPLNSNTIFLCNFCTHCTKVKDRLC